MKVRLLSTILALAAVLFFGGVRSSQAISLVPPTLEFASQPGQTLTGTVKIYNDEKAFQTFYLSTANFTSGGETGEPKFDFAPSDVVDLASWISTDTKQVDLQPGGVAVVGISIKIPKDASPGGHYAGVFFSATPPNSGNVKVQQKTGSLVILRVEGDVREAGQVSSFGTTSGKNTVSHLPVDLTIKIENTGNTHFRPQGFVTIRNMFGGVTSTIDINPRGGAVLPNSTRRFDVTWTKGSPDTGSGLLSEFRKEWSSFALGGYTAEVVATYGSTNQNMTATYHLTVMPWLVIIFLLVVIILIIVLLVVGIRHYNASIIKKAEAKLAKNQTRPPKA